MGHCLICGKRSPLISNSPGLCRECIIAGSARASFFGKKAHERARAGFGLPKEPPRAETGIKCRLCLNECTISAGLSYCGLRKPEGEKILAPSAHSANLSYYFDPLPTNCVADWSAREERAPVIPNTPTGTAQNMGIRTWPFSIGLAPSTAFFARTGTFVTMPLKNRKSLIRSSLRSLTSALPASAFLEETPHPSFPIPYTFLAWPGKKLEVGSCAFAGRLTVP